ncbi:MAG: hypothetical protein ABI076_11660, partial [Acidobacteriaceae bacterium]
NTLHAVGPGRRKQLLRSKACRLIFWPGVVQAMRKANLIRRPDVDVRIDNIVETDCTPPFR